MYIDELFTKRRPLRITLRFREGRRECLLVFIIIRLKENIYYIDKLFTYNSGL